MKVGNVCVVRYYRCVCHCLAQVLFVATYESMPAGTYYWRVAIASHVIKLTLTRTGNTLACSMEAVQIKATARCLYKLHQIRAVITCVIYNFHLGQLEHRTVLHCLIW